MKTVDFKKYFSSINSNVKKYKEELIELDQRFGDGDLGISMEMGFNAIQNHFDIIADKDIGKFFLNVAKTFNENAPSSLGTIISFFFMGMAKYLKNKEEIKFKDIVFAIEEGIDNIKNKASSNEGEKTILDSLIPALNALKSNIEDPQIAIRRAKDEAYKGALNTKNMIAVHGRAAYHNENTLGHMDGGARLASIVFEALVLEV